jgi:hypothetical protein
MGLGMTWTEAVWWFWCNERGKEDDGGAFPCLVMIFLVGGFEGGRMGGWEVRVRRRKRGRIREEGCLGTKGDLG